MTRSKGRKRVNSPARTDRDALLDAWGATVDDDLLELALTHRSWAFENGGVPTNERLELLGDSVLSLVVTDRLFADLPDMSEADLVPIRAAAVSEAPLAEIARSIGLGEFILLGNGELVTDGRNKESILSDTVEALIAATYLSGGMERARPVVEHHTAPLIERALSAGPALDWKTSLQILANEGGLGAVTYEVEGSGPDHARRYVAVAIVAGQRLEAGQGTSRSKAELASAENSYEILKARVGA